MLRLPIDSSWTCSASVSRNSGSISSVLVRSKPLMSSTSFTDTRDCSERTMGANMLGPEQMVEAIFHLRKSVKVLKKKLGNVHPRTTMATRNLERANARPRKIASKRGINKAQRAGSKDGKPALRYHRYIFSERPRGLDIRDDKSGWRVGGQLPAVTGKPKKKGKGKGKGKKKKRK